MYSPAGGRWAGRLHRLADRIDRRFRARIRGLPALERGWIGLLDRIVAMQSDRLYMRRSIVPAIAREKPARILTVGVRAYTVALDKALAASGAELWTCDIDPQAARYGASGGRHVTADVIQLDEHFARGFFDLLLMNGIFGWGVDRPEDMNRALVSAERVLAPGGFLLLGWNHDRTPDPDGLAEIGRFSPSGYSGLPHRKGFADVTHLYAWYLKGSEDRAIDAKPGQRDT